MSFQSSLFAHAQSTKKVTRKEKFLTEMNEVVPWKKFMKIIHPHWINMKHGRPRTDGELLLRIVFLQQWYNLSDKGVEEAIYDQIVFQKYLISMYLWSLFQKQLL